MNQLHDPLGGVPTPENADIGTFLVQKDPVYEQWKLSVFQDNISQEINSKLGPSFSES
jgi:hypothetical protein